MCRWADRWTKGQRDRHTWGVDIDTQREGRSDKQTEKRTRERKNACVDVQSDKQWLSNPFSCQPVSANTKLHWQEFYLIIMKAVNLAHVSI